VAEQNAHKQAQNLAWLEKQRTSRCLRFKSPLGPEQGQHPKEERMKRAQEAAARRRQGEVPLLRSVLLPNLFKKYTPG
jgi:hypothetical protein